MDEYRFRFTGKPYEDMDGSNLVVVQPRSIILNARGLTVIQLVHSCLCSLMHDQQSINGPYCNFRGVFLKLI